MNKYFYLSAMLLFLSCGKDPSVTDDQLLGTWILDAVEGTCLGIPYNSNGDHTGCIDIPTLEVNCSMIEFEGAGRLSYAYNLERGEGSYEILDDGINICTDRCLKYQLEGNKLTLQTGTIELCDPLYTFAKSTSSMDDLISENQRQKIKKLYKNGKLLRDYNYGPDGNLQSTFQYEEDGDLSRQEVYVFTPTLVTRTLTFVQFNQTYKYEYYDEGLNRTRRNRYTAENQLIDYRLYFHSDTECWVDRIETYEDDQLSKLSQYTYSAVNCGQEVSNYKNGNLESKITIQYDGMNYYARSATINLLRVKEFSNITSYTYIRDDQVEPSNSYTATYTYDTAGYPSTEIRNYLDGEVELYTYEYE